MTRVFRSLAVLFVLGLCRCVLAAEWPEPGAVLLIFGDGQQLELKDWAFRYEYGESDSPPQGVFSYTKVEYQDLLLTLGSRTERGVTLNDERKIPAAKLQRIEFRWAPWGDEKDNLHRESATIHLIDGEVIKTPDEGMRPAEKLLSSMKYVFGSGFCPCLYLSGSAVLHGKTGRFEELLSYDHKGAKRDERIVEIRFQRPARSPAAEAMPETKDDSKPAAAP